MRAGEELSGTRSVEGVLRILRSPQTLRYPQYSYWHTALMVLMAVVVAFLQPVLWLVVWGDPQGRAYSCLPVIGAGAQGQ